jgi:hypothetical protein
MPEQRAALLKQTVEFWQPHTSHPLSEEDARQAVENVVGFFATLQRWATAAELPVSQTKHQEGV